MCLGVIVHEIARKKCVDPAIASRFATQEQRATLIDALRLLSHRDAHFVVRKLHQLGWNLQADVDRITIRYDNMLRVLQSTRLEFPSLEESTINVFEHAAEFIHPPLDSFDSLEHLLWSEASLGRKVGQSAINSPEQFMKNWNIFTRGQFEGFDWSGFVAIGGSVLACLTTDAETFGTGFVVLLSFFSPQKAV